MAKAGAIRAGRAFVEIFADKSKLVRGLKSAGADFQAWGKSITKVGAGIAAAGAGIVGTLAGFAIAAGEVGGNLLDTAAQTGLTVEALTSLGYAAGLAGVESESLTGAVGKMQKTLVAANRGSKDSAKAFARLGLSAKELAGLSVEDQFLQVADAISKIDDPAKQAVAAMDIFGKSGAELLPMFQAGAAGIVELQQRARELGIQLSTADAQAADEFGDSIDTLKAQVKALGFRLGAATIPLLKDMVAQLSDAGKTAARWIEQNRGLVKIALELGVAMVGTGAGISAVGSTLAAFGSVLKGVGAFLPFLGKVFSGIAAGVAAIGAPIAIAVAALGALYIAVGKLTGRWGIFAETLGGAFTTFAADAKVAWAGIAAALQSGDLAAAAKIGMGLLNVEFNRVVLQLKTVWADFVLWFKNISAEAWASAAKTASGAWAGIKAKAADAVGMAGTADNFRREGEAAVAAADRALADAKTQHEQDRNAALEESTRALAKAQEDLRAEIVKAQTPAAQQAAGAGSGESSRDKWRKKMAGAAAGVDAGMGKTAGTFSARAAMVVGGGRVNERIAKATEDTVAEVRRLNINLTALSPTFA